MSRAGEGTVRFVQCLLLLALVTACRASDSRSTGSWDSAMRGELLRRYVEDQAVRERLVATMRDGAPPDPAMIAEMARTDSTNTAWLQDAIARRGWPDRSAIGDSGATAAFLLVQHADRDTAFQARMLPALTAAYKRGEMATEPNDAARGEHMLTLAEPQ